MQLFPVSLGYDNDAAFERMGMKKGLLILLFGLLGVTGIFAQAPNVMLRLQSADGNSVKLVWLIRQWKPAYHGFDIRRLEGATNWVTLNKKPLYPEFSAKKDFSLVESDKIETSRIRSRMLKMMAGGKSKELLRSAYLKMLDSNNAFAVTMANAFAQDYDLAMMNGFAYVDHSIVKKESYAYGLFITGTDSLLAKTNWNYGERPDLNVITEITTAVRPNRKGIDLIWDADTDKVDNGSVVGFYIYRDGIRLNQNPLMTPTNKDSCEFVWRDSTADKRRQLQYSISAVSMFGIEGSIRSYIYDPADHPAGYTSAGIPNLFAQGYYIKEGILINWEFPKDQEQFIKGFYIEKNILPEGYKRISQITGPTDREYVDKSPTPLTSYICYRVMTVYKDHSVARGQEKIYSYFPVREPPQPQNLKTRLIQNGSKQTIQLTWNPPIMGDTMTNYYHIYLWDSVDRKYNLLATPKVITNQYDFEVNNPIAANYKFCVSAVSRNKVESINSLPAGIASHSANLPAVQITKILADGNSVALSWDGYPAIADLMGFRIIMNGQPMSPDTLLLPATRTITIPNVGPGIDTFAVQALTETGVESPLVNTASITIAPPPPKTRKERRGE